MTALDVTGEALAALCLLAGAYCIGGLHGLWLAWSQPARMDKWAVKADRLQRAINKSEGIDTDDMRRTER